MSHKFLLTFSIAITMLSACTGKEPSPPPDSPESKPPAPTMDCKPVAAARKIMAATGQKEEATDDSVDSRLRKEREAASNARAKWRGKSFEEFLPTVTKECGENGKYIVNGDVAISDIKQLREFFEKNIQSPAPPPIEVTVKGKKRSVSELVINRSSGEDTSWSVSQKKQLTYCVSSSFNNQKANVVTAMGAAAGAWEQVADVKFSYVSQQDAACNASNTSVVFDVRPVNVDGEYLARAFFPNEPRAGRNVLIDLTALQLDPGEDLTLVGVLRHELGHTLGFRHEHTRPESGACFEDADWRPITSYDNFSVMHYPQCNGGADWKLLLTPRDRSGAACTYGATTGFTIDTTLCTPLASAPLPAGAPTTVSHPHQTVANQAQTGFPTLTAKPGSVLTLRLTPDGASPGDPDLYVRLGASPPRVSPPQFTCRPYLTGATETCEITVRPAPNNQVRYMVHGYTAGAYNLEVTYVKDTTP